MGIFTMAVVTVPGALDFEFSCHFVAVDCSGEDETEGSSLLKIQDKGDVRTLNAA